MVLAECFIKSWGAIQNGHCDAAKLSATSLDCPLNHLAFITPVILIMFVIEPIEQRW